MAEIVSDHHTSSAQSMHKAYHIVGAQYREFDWLNLNLINKECNQAQQRHNSPGANPARLHQCDLSV